MSRRTIGQLASQVGVNVETIRYYHRRGLLAQPEPLQGGWRHYGQDALLTVRFIKLMQDFGFTLREIKGLLSHFPDVEAFCGNAQRAAESKIAQLKEDIRRLSRIRAALSQLSETCRQGGNAAECPAWKAFLGGFD